MPFQPEQDACGALTLCNGYFITPFSYDGKGHTIGEFYGINNTPAGFEHNSVWFRVKVATSGNIVFTISPTDSTNDYDFSVFNTTNLHCPYDIQALTDGRIRYNLNCNGNCPGYPGMPSSPGGRLGLDYVSTDTFTPSGTFGNAFIKYIEAQAGDEYLVMVDNFSQSASGFSIDFAGTTALFQNNGLQYDSVVAECATNYSTLKVRLSQPVLCSSVAANGSDFTLSPGSPVIITGAVGANCSTGQAGSYTWELTLSLSNSLPLGGNFVLSSKTGSDGNSLIDLCGAQQANGYTKPFKVALPITINAGNDTAVCTGSSIALNAQLQGVGNVRIRWQPATFLNNNTILNPVATPATDIQYVVVVAPIGYPAACQYRDTIHIKVLKGFEILTSDTVLCSPEKIPIQLQGDSAFTYTWSPSLYLSGTTGMFQNALPEKSVVYTVKASYPGCKDSIQTINIVIREWPDLMTGDTVICHGQSVPIQVAGSGNFTHIWSPAFFLSDAAAINPVATPDSMITYTLTTSYTGCADSLQSFSIGVEPLPDIAPIGFNTVCFGSTIPMFPSVAPSGYTNYSYQWQPAARFNNAGIANPIYTAINTGMVSLRVSTPHGCADTLSQLLSVSPLPIVNAGSDTSVAEGQAITLQGLVNQPAAIIQWEPAQYLSSNAMLNPVATIPASQNFVLSISNEYGCAAKDSVFISLLKNIYIPNAFSPNGDGINDAWNIPGLSSYQNSRTQVFNRWGQIVFESSGYARAWDGNFKGQQLPIGVYYYIVNLGNNRQPMHGSVTIIK